MNAGLCYCDNAVCRMKTRCKRWKEGCKRRNMRFMFVTYFIVVALHERHWRNLIDDNYDDREKKSSKKN